MEAAVLFIVQGMIPKNMKIKSPGLPAQAGVYLMKNTKGELLYIGKAGNLKRRVSSYFLRAHDARIERLVSKIGRIDYEKTDTALEALILEAKLIKKYHPPFNVREKDDKSFLYIEISRDTFPTVSLMRGTDATQGERFGPFIEAGSVREALRILRRIFPWNVHAPEKIGKFTRPCFDYEIGLCPGTCIKSKISNPKFQTEYKHTIKNLRLILQGKKREVLQSLKKEMLSASKRQEYEKAAQLRKTIFGLEHIYDVALIRDEGVGNWELEIGNSPRRIEGYDISNISGTSAVGSMVVFIGQQPNKDLYRKFKIRTVTGINDTEMIKEVLRRRFKNNWAHPDLILIDGGKGQVNAARDVLRESNLVIPIIGIAKGPKRKKNEFVGIVPNGIDQRTLIRVRDEAHRFAISYHRYVRKASVLPPKR